MPATKNLLAFDLGAESGRAVLGRFDGDHLRIEEIHRFDNTPARILDTFHWDVLRLHNEILTGLRKAAAVCGNVDSIGIDAWGVDFALLGHGGSLLGNPRHYRDPHTETIMPEAFARLAPWEIFRQSGVQFLRFNTLFQLLALQRDAPALVDSAETLLFIPDLFNYFLTGVKANEYTIASTSQMLDPASRAWAFPLLKSFGLPRRILGGIVQPGSVLAQLRPSVASEVGLPPIPVIATASHDTAAAFVSVPAGEGSWACLSSGTWSLLGTELTSPLVNQPVMENNFTNEGGVGGTIRFLKNIMGLWLVQECRRTWERIGRNFSYEDLVRLAETAPPLVSFVDPDDPSFMLPASMPQAIAAYCKRTSQIPPTEPGAVIRCALESLALKYRWVLERLEALIGQPLDTIHIVGGGSRNKLLCQMTTDACNRPVIAGPVEATAIGNLLVQAMGLGLIGSLTEAREVVKRSIDVTVFEPQQSERWDASYLRFKAWLS